VHQQYKNTITQNKLKQLMPRFGRFENGPALFLSWNQRGPILNGKGK